MNMRKIEGTDWWNCGFCGVDLPHKDVTNHLRRAHNLTPEDAEKTLQGICLDCGRNHQEDGHPLSHLSRAELHYRINEFLHLMEDGQAFGDHDEPAVSDENGHYGLYL